jgi:predicted XRE-type DNA-binding protein
MVSEGSAASREKLSGTNSDLDRLRKLLVDSGVSAEEYQASLNEEKLKALSFSLKDIRKAQGLTQTDIAKRLNVSQIRISQLENGKLEKVQLNTLKSYLQAVGVEMTIKVDLDGSEVEIKF